MDKKELRKANGDLFFEAERLNKNTYILANWIGIQTLETIMLGAHQLLTLLHQQPCPAILNSNKELIGPWYDGALFLGNRWAPQIKELGVTYFAHVLAPGIYGQNSFEAFYQRGQFHLKIKTFTSDAEAAAWLLNSQKNIVS